MAYTYSFADNAIYGADDINAAVGRLVTGGVAEVFYDGTSYNTSDLNAITSYIATYGVRDVASNTLKVVNAGNNTVKVLSGCAFMNDGACVEVDAEGVELDYVTGQENYVYIKNNLDSNNTIDFVCSLTEGSGDIVPLAMISSSGGITDTRVYCRGRIAGYRSTDGLPKLLEVPYSISTNNIGATQTVRVDMGGLAYGKIFNMTPTKGESYNTGHGYYDISADKYMSVYPGDDYEMDKDTEKLVLYSSHTSKGVDTIYVTFEIDGSELICTFRAVYGKGNGESDYYTFSGTAYLFVA